MTSNTKEKPRPTLRLVLLVTYACQLDCRYCCVLTELRNQKGREMSLDNILRSADFVLSSSTHQKVQLHFFGAEPLLVPFEHYLKVLPYARQRERETGKELDICVTTNAAMLNERWVRLFQQYGVGVEISVDGDAESHNRNRPTRGNRDSHSLILERLPLIFESGIRINASMVVSPDTAAKVYENFCYLAEVGFKHIFMMVANCVHWPEESRVALKNGLDKIELVYPRLYRENNVFLMNLVDWVWPMRMNTELAVDCDGSIYSACVGYLVRDPQLKKRCTLARIDTVSEGIDKYLPFRLTNPSAMRIVFEQSSALHTVESCARAGAVMAEFVKRVKKALHPVPEATPPRYESVYPSWQADRYAMKS